MMEGEGSKIRQIAIAVDFRKRSWTLGLMAVFLLMIPSLILAQGMQPEVAAGPPASTQPAPVVAASPIPPVTRSPVPTKQSKASKAHGIARDVADPAKRSKPGPALGAQMPLAVPTDVPIATPTADDQPGSLPLLARSTIDFSIAEPVSVNISSSLRARLPTDTLVPDIKATLALQNIATEIQRPLSPAYAPPGDQEFAFAEGGGQDAIIDRINLGYPGANAPLVLITVAERGPYVIAAARVFSPDASGGGKLQRIARFVLGSAEVNISTIKNDWPGCFARALHHFKDNPADATDGTCEKPTLKGTVPDGNAGKAVAAPQPQPAPGPSPVAPVAAPAVSSAPNQQSLTQPSAVLPKVQGLLDDVPERNGVVLGSKNASPQITPSVPQQQAVIIPAIPGEMPPRHAESMDYQLPEQIIAYGFLFRPHDPLKLTDWINGLLSRTDQVGQCLSRRDRAAFWLGDDMSMPHQQQSLPIKKGKDFYYLAPIPLSREMADLPNSCTSPIGIPPFYYVWYAQGPFSLAGAEQSAKDWDASGGATPGWRLPTAIEGFAIATAMIAKARPSEQIHASFWTSINGIQNGMMTIRSEPKTGLLEVDHIINPTEDANRLVLLHN